MIKKSITAILFLIQILCVQTLHSQVPVNMTEQLSHKFQNYVLSVPWEEIYVHSDRDAYISGEDIWFNIYLIDRQSSKPSSGSKIAYFELLNPENRPIIQKKLWLNGGFGPGHITLPDTLSTGTYTIRAYTSWMKNFLPDNCFSREFHVYNAFSSKAFKKKSDWKTVSNTSLNSKNPPFNNSGIALKVDNLKPDMLDITVQSDEKFRSENSNLIYLFIQTHGNINRVSTERLANENTTISISKKQLSQGINQITLFNLKGQPVGERYIYTADNTNTQSNINMVDSTGLRKKVSIEFEAGDALSKTMDMSGFSISVTPATNARLKMDLTDYMIFGTEYGIARNILFKNKKAAELSPEEIDKALLNVKSSWINWNNIVTDDLPVLRYPVENEDHYLSGKLLTGDKKTGDADKYVILSVPGKIASFQYSRTDDQGRFSFQLHIDEKVKDLIILPDVISKGQSINIESPFSDQYFRSDLKTDSTGNSVPEYVSAYSVNHQIRKIYGSTSTGDSLSPIIAVPKFRRFYGKPDDELKMKDYIALPVMQEVFFELLAGVSLKSKKTGYDITVANPENNKPYDTPPGLFVDGVAIKDASVIAALEPDVVEKIDVVRSKYFIGDYLFYGIVNVITKSADFNNVALPDYSVRIPYRAIDPVSSFVSPDYSTADKYKSRMPDFRNTLYWNPSLKPDKTGKVRAEFWTSDYVSDYEVNIQGVTKDGNAISLKKIIKVRK